MSWKTVVSSSYITLEPSRSVVTSSASRSTARCREIVGHAESKDCAMSPDDFGPDRNNRRISRRVGSASALKTRSSSVTTLICDLLVTCQAHVIPRLPTRRQAPWFTRRRGEIAAPTRSLVSTKWIGHPHTINRVSNAELTLSPRLRGSA